MDEILGLSNATNDVCTAIVIFALGDDSDMRIAAYGRLWTFKFQFTTNNDARCFICVYTIDAIWLAVPCLLRLNAIEGIEACRQNELHLNFMAICFALLFCFIHQHNLTPHLRSQIYIYCTLTPFHFPRQYFIIKQVAVEQLLCSLGLSNKWFSNNINREREGKK